MEVMMATAMVGILSVVIAQVLTTMNYTTGKADQVSNTNELKSLMKNTLSSPLSCIRTVGTLSSISTDPLNPTKLNPNQLVQAQRITTGTGFTIATIVMYPTAAHGTPPGFPDAIHYGSLKSIEFGVVATTALAPNKPDIPGWFNVDYKVATQGGADANSRFKIPLHFSTDGTGKLKGCYTIGIEVCSLLGGQQDPDTGLCNQIDIQPSSPGSIRGNGLITSQGAPVGAGTTGFSFTGDLTSGLFRTGGTNPGQGALGLYVNNTEVVHIDGATTKVGILTTNPLNQLDVAGSVAIGAYAGTKAAPANGMIVSGPVGIGSTGGANNMLTVGGNSFFNGQVGIKTNSPQVALDVNGKIWMRDETVATDPNMTVVTKGYAHTTLFASKGACTTGNQVLMGFNNNGDPICGNTDAITTKNCPAGYYLIGYVGGQGQTGQQVCVPLSSIGACGPKQFMAGVDASGTKICKTLFEVGVCGYGTTLGGIDAAGNSVCTNKAEGGSCPAGQAAVGVSWDGKPICGNKANGGTCPGHQMVKGITTGGAPICSGIPQKGTAKIVYQCPRINTGCGNGNWWSQGCVGQLTTVTQSCMNVTWTGGWCQQDYNCPQMGIIYVQ